jgi:hypothetical protein
MEHTLEILVELEVDGAAMAGFPFRHLSQVDYLEPFVAQDFSDAGYTSPLHGPASQLQALLVTADQDFSVKLNSETAQTFDLFCGGFLLLIGAAIDLAPFVTVKATGTVPAMIWGFAAGKQT